MITKPELPPRKGFVEVEVNGVRRYRNVSTGALLKDETPPDAPTEPTAEEDLMAMAIDHELRLTALELGI